MYRTIICEYNIFGACCIDYICCPFLFLHIQAESFAPNGRKYVIRNSGRRWIPQRRLLTRSAGIKTHDVHRRLPDLRRCVVVQPIVDPLCQFQLCHGKFLCPVPRNRSVERAGGAGYNYAYHADWWTFSLWGPTWRLYGWKTAALFAFLHACRLAR
jgi:hypothetical protein